MSRTEGWEDWKYRVMRDERIGRYVLDAQLGLHSMYV
jgi:hypothetical protein